MGRLRERLYDASVAGALWFYERWVLPQGWWAVQRVGIRELKLREFRERRALLNPYKREQLIAQSVNSDHLQKLAEKVQVGTMYTFKISFDRHKDRYLYREKDFPAEYSVNESTLNYAMDPDWTQKLGIKRLNLKKAFLFAALIFLWVRRRVAMVEEFDRLKRIEQRAMQNTEIEELANKKVSFQLETNEGKDYSEKDNCGREYVVLWYDAKMKNYLLFIEHLHKKKFIQAKVTPILVVDKPHHMQNIEKIRKESKDERTKAEVRVMLLKEPTEKERLLREFSQPDDVTDLEVKKSFFYVINPDGKIIDCAKIYSFLHEDNIFKRITAKISKDIDDRINNASE